MIDSYFEFKKIGNELGCEKQCPLECTQVEYELEHSSSAFPSRQYAQEIMSDAQVRQLMEDVPVTYENVRDSLVSLLIAYEDIEYTMISEQPTLTIIDVIANVGGTLGLFIGISLLSVFELAEILIKILGIWLRNESKKHGKQSYSSSAQKSP